MRTLRWLALGAVGYGSLAAAAAAVVRRHETLRADEAAPPGAFATIDGVRLHYTESGGGPPAVLIHGLGASVFSYRETVPALSPRFHTFALDLPGFGYSERGAQHDYSAGGQARTIAAFLDARGLRDALVVGHSLGGAVVLRLAAIRPDLVSRLVLVAAVDPNRTLIPPLLVRLLRPLLPLSGLATALTLPLRRRMMQRTVHDPAFVTDALLEGYERPSRIEGTAAAMRRLLTDAGRDRPLDLSTVRQPTLLLWGASDQLVPIDVGRQLLESIPDARLEVVPEAGHLVLEEKPAAANAVLLHWLEETESAASGGEATR